MAIKENITIEGGFVMGKVSTNRVGSECIFPICTEEEFKEMTEDQAYEALQDAMWDYGCVDVYF